MCKIILKKIKHKLYYYLVAKNGYIKSEYEQYVNKHISEHNSKRLQHWIVLIKLNWHYRFRRRTIPLICDEKNSNNLEGTPYFEGAESEFCQRTKAEQFVKTLLNYDVISFDIFDTLIFRPFADPNDIHYLTSYNHYLYNFKNIRIQAEKECRDLHEQQFGNREVTIYDIYKRLSYYANINVNESVDNEFQMELDICSANPYMLKVFKMLKSQGKRIIAVSDMYYPEQLLKKLLMHVGFDGFEKIYVSCDYHMRKSTGNLYKAVQNELGTHLKICHIGDNWSSDILQAKKSGWEAKHYRNVNAIGKTYRVKGMSEIIGSAYRGIVNKRIHSGNEVYSPYFEYGYIYGGIYILGYCCWIHKYALEHNIDKILFLARDGDIYQKIYSQLFQDIPFDYVYWSRIANIKYSIDDMKYYFFKEVLYHKVKNNMDFTIEALLESLDLQLLLDDLDKYNLKKTDIIVSENVKQIENYLNSHFSTIINKFQESSPVVNEYFYSKINNCKNIAVIDVGWAGTGPLGIKKLIEDKWQCNVHCLLAACIVPDNITNQYEVLSDMVQGYLFSRTHNRNLYDGHQNTWKNVYFELFTQAPFPSFSGFSNSIDGSVLFDIPEVENYSIIREIQVGIDTFCKDYQKAFKKYPFMFNIPGYDAYLPFQGITRNRIFFEKFFGDFSFSRGVCGNPKKQAIETLNDIWNKH